MKIKNLTPELIVDNVNRSIDFYSDVLGFHVTATVPDNGQFDWAQMRLGDETNGSQIMFETRQAVAKELPGDHNKSGVIIYLEVEDIIAWYRQVKSKTQVQVELHKTFYDSQEFALQDPDGYWIILSERQ